MSDGAQVYDAVELRRRIVVCFSIGELRQLADSLGVGGSIAWERGIQEASRDVVRQCERYAGLPALVAKLREVRPLVEWPEAAEAAPPIVFSAAPAPLPGLGPGTPPQLGAPAEPVPGPAASDLPDPFAPAAPPRPIEMAVAPSPPSPPSPPSRPAPVWPGMASASASASPGVGGVDPRILVAVAALMVVAAVIAYLAGRASSGGPTAGAAPADSAGAATPRRPEGPATMAADTLARSLANVARQCELPASAGGNVLVFRRVLDRCGPVPPPPRLTTAPVAAQPEPSADPPPDPPPARTRRPGRGGDAASVDPGGPGKGCAGGCEATHRACTTGCGPEPTESSGDEGYRRCLGRCLSDASRCRLSCR